MTKVRRGSEANKTSNNSERSGTRTVDDNGLRERDRSAVDEVDEVDEVAGEDGRGGQSGGSGGGERVQVEAYDDRDEKRSGKRDIRRRKGARSHRRSSRPVFQEDNNFIKPILSPPVSTLSSFMNMYARPAPVSRYMAALRRAKGPRIPVAR